MNKVQSVGLAIMLSFVAALLLKMANVDSILYSVSMFIIIVSGVMIMWRNEDE